MGFLKNQGVVDLEDLKRANQKVIEAIRSTGNGDCYYGRELIVQHKDDIRQIDAELKRRRRPPCDPPEVKVKGEK